MAEYVDPQTLERLVRIETKLDTFMTNQVDHEGRIRKLEKVIWIAAGLAAAGGGTAGGIVSQLLGG